MSNGEVKGELVITEGEGGKNEGELDKSVITEIEDGKRLISILLDFESTHDFETYLREGIDKNLIGQKEAKEAITEHIVSGVLSIRPKKGPLTTLFFAGPTGVGKTEMVKALAKTLLGDSSYFTKISCENYQESHTTRDLFGAPKSYVGYGDPTPLDGKKVYGYYDIAKKSGKLHDLIRQINGFNIILFDEIEKAHPNVHQALLSLIDDGRIEFSNGNVCRYNNSIVIFTSNVGQKELSDILSKSIGFVERTEDDIEKEKIDVLKKSMRKVFSPEFMGRLDNVIEFKNLKNEECDEIIDLHLSIINNHLSKYYPTSDISISLDESIYKYIKENGYSDAKGARELIRVLETKIESKINVLLRSEVFVKYFNYDCPIEIKATIGENSEIKFYILYEDLTEINIEEKEKTKNLPAIVTKEHLSKIPTKTTLKFLNEIFKKSSLYIEMYHVNMDGDVDFSTDLKELEIELRAYGLSTDDILYLRNRAYIEELEELNFIDTFEGIKILDGTKRGMFYPLDNRTIYKIIDKKLDESLGKYGREEAFVVKALQKVIEIVTKLLKVEELSGQQQKILIEYVTRAITEKYS